MLSGFVAALGKDFRLLLRDRVGLVFMTLAPVVVITVAGLSLAHLYGATGRTSAFLPPLVDEDGGRVGRSLAERLRDDRAVRVALVPKRGAARALVRAKADGRGAGRARGHLGGARRRPAEPAHPLHRPRQGDRARRHSRPRAGDPARGRARGPGRGGGRARSDAAPRARGTRRARCASGPAAELPRRPRRARARLHGVGGGRARAGGALCGSDPPPPDPPAVPPALAELARAKPAALAARLVSPVSLPPLPTVELPPLPAPPAGLHLPELPEPPAVHLPGMLAIEETSVTGAPRTFNTFDQNVPGFSITFLLLGILLGISLALLDEGHVAELTIADSITSFPACVPFWSAGSLN
jgi:hypothetical protein